MLLNKNALKQKGIFQFYFYQLVFKTYFFNMCYRSLWKITDDAKNIQDIFRKLSGYIQNIIISNTKKFQGFYDRIKKSN